MVHLSRGYNYRHKGTKLAAGKCFIEQLPLESKHTTRVGTAVKPGPKKTVDLWGTHNNIFEQRCFTFGQTQA